jgi:DNA-binding transcriptional ArsR family regulator
MARPAEASHDGVCDIRMIHLDKVDRARRSAIPADQLERLAKLYKALGDPTRLGLVMALRGGEMCVCDLAATLGMTESAVSHQLRRLREEDLARSRREGQVVYYSLSDDHVVDLLGVGLAHAQEKPRRAP